MSIHPPLNLLARRSEPDIRAVLDDWREDHAQERQRLGVILELVDADADAAADADADAAAAAADADADAADADAERSGRGREVRAGLFKLLMEEHTMKDGLTLLQVTGGYYGRAVTLVGWLRRVAGDEFEMLPGHVTVWRESGSFQQNGLDILASKGLVKGYVASPPAEAPEQIHRLLVRRPKPANEEAWKKVLPRPKDWPTEKKSAA